MVEYPGKTVILEEWYLQLSESTDELVIVTFSQVSIVEFVIRRLHSSLDVSVYNL